MPSKNIGNRIWEHNFPNRHELQDARALGHEHGTRFSGYTYRECGEEMNERDGDLTDGKGRTSGGKDGARQEGTGRWGRTGGWTGMGPDGRGQIQIVGLTRGFFSKKFDSNTIQHCLSTGSGTTCAELGVPEPSGSYFGPVLVRPRPGPVLVRSRSLAVASFTVSYSVLDIQSRLRVCV